MKPANNAHLEPTQELGAAFYRRGLKGSVAMLNLLAFREVADYSAHPHLSPSSPISGEEAYGLYVEHTRPFLEAAGGEVLWMGRGGQFLIGPEDEKWDLALLVRHQSTEAFMQFARNKAYLAGIGHRIAALADARLLPLEQVPNF